ncbi:caspase-7-like [Babylonia areolata]|uniref:caspase-7-like n=1 Tax=Babylonia areolata TaxID=304850 RepID=UPI003FD00E4A
MDDSHNKEGEEEVSASSSSLQPHHNDSDVEGNQEQMEASAEENEEEMEEDETEGLSKSLRRSFKAVKRFFKGPGDGAKKVDPKPTFSDERPTPVPPVSQEPSDEDDDVYNFTHKYRGRAIIINNEKFLRSSLFESRPGSTCDEKALKEVFKYLGFDVKCYYDLTAIEIKIALEKEVREYDHSNADCLAVAILSHGDSEIAEKALSYHQQKAHKHDDKVRRDLIFGVDGNYISTASVIRTFQDSRCPGLEGKPRLFFLQACRGDGYDDGLKVHVVPDTAAAADGDAGNDSDRETDASDTRGIHSRHTRHVVSPAPIFKDFLVMYATVPGHFAWRRPSGTWFIQSLRTVFMKQLTQQMSLTQALTRVSRRVAQSYESQGKMSGKKQMPVVESMLVKDVYFPVK